MLILPNYGRPVVDSERVSLVCPTQARQQLNISSTYRTSGAKKASNPADVILALNNAPARLVRLAILAGIHEQGYQFSNAEIRKLQRESDLQDCINCTPPELQAWASALAIRATRQRGKTPAGLMAHRMEVERRGW